MSEAILIFQHMRGGCATVGNTVHALFRVNGRRPGLAQIRDASLHAPETAPADNLSSRQIAEQK